MHQYDYLKQDYVHYSQEKYMRQALTESYLSDESLQRKPRTKSILSVKKIQIVD